MPANLDSIADRQCEPSGGRWLAAAIAFEWMPGRRPPVLHANAWRIDGIERLRASDPLVAP